VVATDASAQSACGMTACHVCASKLTRAVVDLGGREMWTSSSCIELKCTCFGLILAWFPSIDMACDYTVLVPELQLLNTFG